MRILTVGNMYPPHHQGGYERMWAAAVAALRARGHDVTVLTTTHREPGVADAPEPGVHRTLQWYWEDHVFRPLGALETWRLERANARAYDAVAAGADAVMWWAMGGMSLSLLARARRARPRPATVAVVHDGWPVYGPKFDRFTARYGRHLPRTRVYDAGHVDHWSFNSRYSRDLLGRGGVRIDGASASVEYPGVDLARFPAHEPRKSWRWRLAYVGRVEPRKGVATALRALAALPEGRLTIAGAGETRHEQELRALASELRISERVRWLGAVDDPAAVYADADAVLFPAEWEEPFGLVPLEAMAVGRPVVATGTGGSIEYLRDGDNALLVAPGDVHVTTGAVMRLAQDPALRARLREGGAQTAQSFTLDAFCDAIAGRVETLAK